MAAPRLTAVAIVVLLACPIAPAAGGTEEDHLSPIVVTPVPQKRIVPVLGSDGRYRVLYELQLTNTLKELADLRAVEVREAASADPLLKLDADDIVKGSYLHTLDRRAAEDTTFGPFESRVLVFNLAFDARDRVPSALTHRFEIAGADPINLKPAIFTYPRQRGDDFGSLAADVVTAA